MSESEASIESGEGVFLANQEEEMDINESNTAHKAFESLEDLPLEAVSSKTKVSFSSAAKRHYMGQFPHATSGEINEIVNRKWQVLRDIMKTFPDDLNKYILRRSKVKGEDQGTDDDERPRRFSRRAREVAKGAYAVDDWEGSDCMDVDMPSPQRGKGGPRRGKKKVPPLRIRVLGRGGEGSGSSSPMFLAETMGELSDDSDFSLPKSKKAKTTSEESVEEDIEKSESEISDEDISFGHSDYCYACRDGGELICCDKCPLAYHLRCVIPPLSNVPEGEWICHRCLVKPLQGKVQRIITWKWVDLVSPSNKTNKGQDIPELVKPYRQREFLVKWKDRSYWEATWLSELSMDVHQQQLLRSYVRKSNMDTPPPLCSPHKYKRIRKRSSSVRDDNYMDGLESVLLTAGVKQEWLKVQRIINKRATKSGTRYLVKWRSLPYDQATWETIDNDTFYPGAVEALKQFEKMRTMFSQKRKEKKRRREFIADPNQKYEEQPVFITHCGGRLHPYQLEGLNWLRFSWVQKTHTILADEMGLGKTIQTISFLYSLLKEGHCNGPFLVSAPLSTIINWEREFELWAPDMYVVVYSGDKDCRAAIREHEFSLTEVQTSSKSGSRLYKWKKDCPVKFHVLLTSYELVSLDSTLLSSIDWAVLVVDEAHRLKNNQSKFFRVLSGYNIQYKLLLTGTPLQNNLEELFNLLNFLDPQDFSSLEEFQEEFEDISKEEQVQKLHDLLKPHLLRRLKADVLKGVPSKSELIVRVELSPLQKQYYKHILTRNFEALSSRGGQSYSLINIMMELKKCCNHPYLIPSAAEKAPLTSNGYYEGEALISSCGKLIVLDKMLKALKETGHRVLIFSQMTKMLDIMEDFLDTLGYKFERIDGSITGFERQEAIDRFNSPTSEGFVFLLSTRAGGLGINLATADTVIIYDSDWNPHNDIQALSRAHRIGQSNKVMIYRFVTRSSVEERILEVAKRKMMLTHLVVRPGMGSGQGPSVSKRELDDILKFGTEELFKEGEVDDKQQIVYDDAAIEALLDRSRHADVAPTDKTDSGQLLANEYLSSFKVASYVTKENTEEEAEEKSIVIKETQETSENDPLFWEKLLRHHFEQQKEMEASQLGKGKRVRKKVNYLDPAGQALGDSEGSEYEQDSSGEESEDGDDADFLGGEVSKKMKAKGLDKKGRDDKGTVPPFLSKLNETLLVYGFNPRQRRAFYNVVLRYGMPPIENGALTSWCPRELRIKSLSEMKAYSALFQRHACEPAGNKAESFSDGIPKEGFSKQLVLTRIGTMKIIRNKVDQYREINGKHWLESTPQEFIDSLSEDTLKQIMTKSSVVKETKPHPSGPVDQDQEVVDVRPEDETQEHPLDQDMETDAKLVTLKEPEFKISSSKFMFNISDGGFTELHSLWHSEREKGFDPSIWSRRHDYWLLYGIVKHGYLRWNDMCYDASLDIINRPFLGEDSESAVSSDSKQRFLVKRLKLLEQALVVEEQLHRAASLGLQHDPKLGIMQLHSRYTELDCLLDGHKHLLEDVKKLDRNAILLLRRALSKMDDLLNDMKADLSKLPLQLAKIDSVTNQLQMSEMGILSRMASHFGPMKQSAPQPPQPSQPPASSQHSTVVIDVDAQNTVLPTAVPTK